ncbi:MAG: hypothetical protein Q8M94_02745, partial [Ignavibacteria bacterium]|nr:hypothetical protein [Ignavibacteria bacterium]
MEILIQISEYLLTAIFFAPIVLLVVDIVKVPVNHLLEVFTCPKPEKLFWYVSIVLGALLGYLLLPELGHSN